MKSLVVGTAGHIDHGKTALVKALTGIDADRLLEEKRRGITIDLGFAHMELPGPDREPVRFSFIDVPGHERFVRNMLAGASGIDLALLVIAADEGIKPQTREHFEILRLLGVRSGMVALTKTDLVEPDIVQSTTAEIRDWLNGSFLATAEIIPLSAKNGDGIDALKQSLIAVAQRSRQRTETSSARMPIDRVFSMKGFGTVVTGTVISGAITAESEVEILPGKDRVRVRGIQVHGKKVGRAVAGERAALNLASVTIDALTRGMVAAAPAAYEATNTVDVSLEWLSGIDIPRTGTRVHFHAHSFETTARLVRTEGSAEFYRLRLMEPTVLVPGDRFIVRRLSPAATIGGGVVLDAHPLKRRGRDHAQLLRELASGDPQRTLMARVARRGKHGISETGLATETGWTRDYLSGELKKLEAQHRLKVGNGIAIDTPSFARAASDIVQRLHTFHDANSLSPGMKQEELRDAARLKSALFKLALDALLREKKIESAGDVVRLPGRGVVMKDDEAEARATIDHAFASAGLRVPSLDEVLSGLKLDRVRAHKIVTLMLRDKSLIKVSPELAFHSKAIQSLRQLMAAEKAKNKNIDVARFKDLTGVSRKYAIPLLEFLDRERVTRREGNVRVFL